MPKFGRKSFSRLRTCDIRLVDLFAEVVKEFDCTVLEGSRGALIQMGYYHSIPRKTKLAYPESKHNPNAIDIPGIANILHCAVSMGSIKLAIVNATPGQLMKIDELDPLEKSLAVDVVPYSATKPHIDWSFESDILLLGDSRKAAKHAKTLKVLHNIERWAMFVGVVKGIASQMKIKIRSGSDWDGDNCMSDQKFDDWPHFEIVE